MRRPGSRVEEVGQGIGAVLRVNLGRGGNERLLN